MPGGKLSRPQTTSAVTQGQTAMHGIIAQRATETRWALRQSARFTTLGERPESVQQDHDWRTILVLYHASSGEILAAAGFRPHCSSSGRTRFNPEGLDMKAASDPKRVLVVVDRAIVDVASVPASVARAERQADEVYVIAPILTNRTVWLTNDDGAAIDDAETRLAAVLKRMQDQGIKADGAVSDESPLTAIDGALVKFPADEIIITVHSDDDRHWRERGLVDRICSRHPQPLTEVVVEADGAASIRSSALPRKSR